MNTKPSLETCAGLYAAAVDIKDPEARELAISRVAKAAGEHGYTEGQLCTALFYPAYSPTPVSR